MSSNTREPPDWLSDEARAVWEALPADVVSSRPVDALAVYCCAAADFARAQQDLDRTGVLMRGARGGVVRSPLNIVKAENAHTVRALAAQLGLLDREDAAPASSSSEGYRNRAATERTVAALRHVGRLEEPDAGLVALARHLAQALDRLDPARYPAQVASLARVHLATLRSLRGQDDEHTPAGGIDELLALLSAPVGDSPIP